MVKFRLITLACLHTLTELNRGHQYNYRYCRVCRNRQEVIRRDILTKEQQPEHGTTPLF